MGFIPKKLNISCIRIHKILYAIRSLGHPTLKWIGEIAETYFLESDKGKTYYT
jgi:hypothetical protein